MAPRKPGPRCPLALLAAVLAILLPDSAFAVTPFPPYGTYPCSSSTENCQGGDLHDDFQTKGLTRSARSTCLVDPDPVWGGTCGYAGTCLGSYQWCRSETPPELGSIKHSQVSPTEIQLDIPYDFPNNYCQFFDDGLFPPKPYTWPLIGTHNTFIEIVGGHQTYAVFENGRWKPTVGCSSQTVFPLTITVRATACTNPAVTPDLLTYPPPRRGRFSPSHAAFLTENSIFRRVPG